jgi:hypothetical protein
MICVDLFREGNEQPKFDDHPMLWGTCAWRNSRESDETRSGGVEDDGEFE